ncbi:PilN domain-containing protein [Bacillus kexueae]|uniref:PilN domain-containing protein n=1 Tax=Aeribacillus kexueae TaxID=2078952 RepID=UPI001FAEFB23|nr:PilN domain-containing protein [Bacillus kexueae]
MLIEINLLQKKEPKKKAILFYILFLVVITLILGIALFSQYREVTTDIKSIDQQLTAIQIEQKEFETNTKTESPTVQKINELKTFTDIAKSNQLDTVDLLTRLSKLLPTESYFTDFQLSGNVMNVTVHIQKEMDAAFYYRHLLNESWIENVILEQVVANRTGEEETENQLSTYVASYKIMIDRMTLKELQKEASE